MRIWVCIFCREGANDLAIEKQGGFKFPTIGRPCNLAYEREQLQPAREGAIRSEHTLQPAAQIGSACDVRFAAFAEPERKDSGCCRQFRKLIRLRRIACLGEG